MSEPTPRTEAGRTFRDALLAQDRLNGETVPVDWGHGIVAIEAEATAAEHERAVNACAHLVLEARAAALAELRGQVEDHSPWARAIFYESRLWLACSCGWNAYGGADGTWDKHFAVAVLALLPDPVTEP